LFVCDLGRRRSRRRGTARFGGRFGRGGFFDHSPLQLLAVDGFRSLLFALFGSRRRGGRRLRLRAARLRGATHRGGAGWGRRLSGRPDRDRGAC